MRTVQRTLALGAMWLVLWYLYSTTDVEYGWAVWCVWGIGFVLEHLSYQNGVADGIVMYRSLTAEQQQNINDIMDKPND